MRLPSCCELVEALSGDPTRPHLYNAWLDVDAKALVATNGHIIAVVPVDVDEHDVSGAVSRGAIEAMRKAAHEMRAEAGFVVVDGDMYKRPDVKHPAATAVQRADVIPDFRRGDDGTITFAISPALLNRLAEAMGKSGIAAGVTLTVKLPPSGAYAVPTDPIVVCTENHDADQPYGALMQRRRFDP